jgi:glycosyltransferase involved in cell wall biosynthesis
MNESQTGSRRETGRVPSRRQTDRVSARETSKLEAKPEDLPKLRVAVVAPALELNGLTLYTRTLMRSLRKLEHKIMLISPTGPLLETLSDACDRRFELEPRLGMFGWRRLKAQVQEFAPDVIHVVAPEPSLPHIKLADAIGCPLVVSIHGVKADEMPPVGDTRYDAYLASDQSVRQKLLNHCRLDRERTALLPDCAYPEHAPVEHDVLDPRRRQVVGWVGPVTEESGYNTFVEAAMKVQGRGHDAMFSVLGSGSAVPHLREMVEDRGMLQRVIVVENLYDYSRMWQPFDIVVVDSRQRAAALVVLHAMANGRPVIANEGGAVFDLIDDGVDGLIVPRHDADTLAERLLMLVENPEERLRMGREGFRKIEERFQPAEMAKACTGVYVALIRDEPLPRNLDAARSQKRQ